VSADARDWSSGEFGLETVKVTRQLPVSVPIEHISSPDESMKNSVCAAPL